MTATDSTESERLKQRLVSLTRDLILMPSSAARPEDRQRCYEFIKNHLDALDTVEIREYSKNDIPSVIAAPRGCAHPEVLLCGHLDVVAHTDPALFRSRLENGRIYGPGAADMKGPLAIMLEIFRHVHTLHPGASLGMAVTADEESGGEHGVGYLFNDAGVRCGLAMIPDAGSLNRIAIEEKGILHMRTHSTGRPAHGARPWAGINPIEILIARLVALKEGFDAAWPPDNAEDHWHPTCTVTLIGTPNQSVNAIPAEAEAILDIRFPAPHTVAEMAQFVNEILGVDIETTTLIGAEPTHLSPDETYRKITEEITGEPARFVRGHGGSDARFICALGIPVLMSRPLSGNLHAPDEWIDIASMLRFHRIYERYLEHKLRLAL